MDIIVLYTDPIIKTYANSPDSFEPGLTVDRMVDHFNGKEIISYMKKDCRYSVEEKLNNVFYTVSESNQITGNQLLTKRKILYRLSDKTNQIIAFRKELLCGLKPIFRIKRLHQSKYSWMYDISIKVADVKILQYTATNNMITKQPNGTRGFDHPYEALEKILGEPISPLQILNAAAPRFIFGDIMMKIEANYRKLTQQIEEQKQEISKLAANQRVDPGTLTANANVTWKMSAKLYKLIVANLPAEQISGEIIFS